MRIFPMVEHLVLVTRNGNKAVLFPLTKLLPHRSYPIYRCNMPANHTKLINKYKIWTDPQENANNCTYFQAKPPILMLHTKGMYIERSAQNIGSSE